MTNPDDMTPAQLGTQDGTPQRLTNIQVERIAAQVARGELTLEMGCTHVSQGFGAAGCYSRDAQRAVRDFKASVADKRLRLGAGS